MFEHPQTESGDSTKEKLETSKRLLLALESVKLNFSKIELVGKENLAELPPGARVVIAVDHLTNLSLPTAALEIGRLLPIHISNQSTQFSFRENPQGHLGVAVGGKKNFEGIDYDPETEKPKPLNPENFDQMLEPLNEGYAIMVAAHNPADTNLLPDAAGYGAAYLAGIADAYILPVSVDIKSDNVHIMESNTGLLKNMKGALHMLRNRPEVIVTIGHPRKEGATVEIQRFHQLFMKRKEGGALSSVEFEEFKRLRTSLDSASEKIMYELADMLPPDKRGKWVKDDVEK